MAHSRKQRFGFTMIELMIVVGIIGVLATVAIPTFGQYKVRARLSEGTATLGALFRLQASHFGQTITAEGMAGAEYNQCMIACSGPDNVGVPIIPGADPVPYDFNSHAGCAALGFTTSAPTRFWYTSVGGGGAGDSYNQVVPGGVVRYACLAPTFVPGDLFGNTIAIWDNDADGSPGIIQDQYTTDENGALRRSGLQFSGDMDDQ